MPMTVIVLRNVPASLRGDLSRWMQEISTGVYVGNFNSRIRELLWKRVSETAGTGEAILCFAARNELGYDFRTFNSTRKVVDFDGIPLVFIPKDPADCEATPVRSGFSKASQMHMARKGKHKSDGKPEDYVVIDLETTGLDASKDQILEIGAVRYFSGNTDYFQRLIHLENKIPDAITRLTGITNELMESEGTACKTALQEFLDFIEELPLVGYHTAFDIEFLNQALQKQGLRQLSNKVYDLMKTVKKEQQFQQDYKLETSLKSYGINTDVPHRALEDAKLIFDLSKKVKNF